MHVEESPRWEWDDYRECEACASKPGSPPLCPGCLHNRTAISRLNQKIRLQRKLISALGSLAALAGEMD